MFSSDEEIILLEYKFVTIILIGHPIKMCVTDMIHQKIQNKCWPLNRVIMSMSASSVLIKNNCAYHFPLNASEKFFNAYQECPQEFMQGNW